VAPSLRRRDLPPILFALLLGASILAAAIALSARGPELAIELNKPLRGFTPGEPGKEGYATIRFFLRQGDPDTRVEIVGDDLRLVRTLAPSLDLAAGERVAFRWNGRTNSGRPAPAGDYRLRVIEPSQERDMVYPVRFALRR
jgi:hypothetical protein